MTINEAIKQQIKAAEAFENSALEEGVSELTRDGRKKVADEHRQIAEWLNELIELRKLCSDRQAYRENYYPNCGAKMDGDNND